MKVGPKGCDVNFGKRPNYIIWFIGIINCEKWGNDWECMGLKGVVELFITHRNEMLI